MKPPGARRDEEGLLNFNVWAPLKRKMELELIPPFSSRVPMRGGDMGYWNVELEYTGESQIVPMEKDGLGYWNLEMEVDPGTLYRYVIEGEKRRPDPASFHQPHGVHGPSMIFDQEGHRWKDEGWRTPQLKDMIFYELHIGTFSRKGTFEGAVGYLDELVDLGITAVEIMPVAQFPGERNWGYDGVYPYAVHDGYGGPKGLKRFVDACHGRGLSVVLDVVYNHLGPEGNYLAEFAPYFTSKVSTPWGEAMNFDQPYSYGVRHFFVENALYWLDLFHIDGLRLDAVHSIWDRSPVHIINEIVRSVSAPSRGSTGGRWIICENDDNDVRVMNEPEIGGYGADAQWNDDFHHAVHSLVTGNRNGYFHDFGTLEMLVKALGQGYVHSWEYSGYRKKWHGSYSEDLPGEKLVVFIQNHDQVGNGGGGKRLSGLIPFEELKICAGLMLLSPYVPLLFMGEEYAETRPFYYFVDHSDTSLIDGVRKGRKELRDEFGFDDPLPDPAGMASFDMSILDRGGSRNEVNEWMRSLYGELISLRKKRPALKDLGKKGLEVSRTGPLLTMKRSSGEEKLLVIANTSEGSFDTNGVLPPGRWKKIIDTSETSRGGPGSTVPDMIGECGPVRMNPHSLVLLEEVKE